MSAQLCGGRSTPAGLSLITVLPCFDSLRRRIEALLLPDNPIIVLQLDALTERRALASMDGKMAEFDEGRDRNDLGAWLYPPRRRGCWTRLLAVVGALMDDVLMHERVSVNVS